MARTKNSARIAPSAAHAAPAPAPIPATGPVPGNAAAAVHAALTAKPGATVAAIAAVAGIGLPAVRDALAALEAASAATRTKGGRPGVPDTWTLTTGPGRNQPAGGSGQDDAHASTSYPGDDLDGGEQDDSGQPRASSPPTNADGDPGPASARAAQPDSAPADGDPAGADTAASHEQDETASATDGSAPTDAPPDPALTTEIVGHIGQIQAAASAAATALADGGDLRAVQAGLDEIYEQAAQARRAAKAAAGGKKAPAAQPGGLREKVLGHLRDHPGQSFTPHDIHKVLGHSSGAIANALDTLVKHGDAELATEKPRKFQLAGGTAPGGDQVPAEAEAAGAGDGTDLAGAA